MQTEPVTSWSPRLPDLKTRLAITPVARIDHPDDRLFAGLIQLHFADRGLHVPADAVRFNPGQSRIILRPQRLPAL